VGETVRKDQPIPFGMKRSVGIGLVLVLAILLGAAREFFFLNLNYAIDHLANHRAVSFAHSAFQAAVDGLGLRDLMALKWVGAITFILAMLVLTLWMARFLFGDHRYRIPILILTLAVGLLALALHLAGGLHPAFDLVSVKLLHLLQYPGILLFLWVASMLRPSPVVGA